MSKEFQAKVLRQFQKFELEVRLRRALSFPEEVTRALEPTYSKEKRKQLLEEIQLIQKDLNRQKNLLSKISKELRKLPY